MCGRQSTGAVWHFFLFYLLNNTHFWFLVNSAFRWHTKTIFVFLSLSLLIRWTVRVFTHSEQRPHWQRKLGLNSTHNFRVFVCVLECQFELPQSESNTQITYFLPTEYTHLIIYSKSINVGNKRQRYNPWNVYSISGISFSNWFFYSWPFLVCN